LHQARAQLATAPAGQLATAWGAVEVIANQYLWIPWTTVEAQTAKASASETIGPGDMISHMTWVPYMGAAEFRSGPFGVGIDYIHAPIKFGIGTQHILFGTPQAHLGIDIGTAMFLYRTIVSPADYVDLGVGVRAWGINGTVAISRRLLPAATVTKGVAWPDALIAARYRHEFGNELSATAYADAGGFGAAANIDWQLIVTLDYAVRPGVELHAGFRGLNVNIGTTPIDVTTRMYGPIISATLRF